MSHRLTRRTWAALGILLVAIPALIFWRYFRARVDGYTLELELSAERFARHLEPLCPGRSAEAKR